VHFVAHRDRPEINCAVIEEKNGSDFEDFSAADILLLPARKNRQKMNRFFPPAPS
jgi:hypothetical protein